jgi:hypothetical protein
VLQGGHRGVVGAGNRIQGFALLHLVMLHGRMGSRAERGGLGRCGAVRSSGMLGSLA